LNINLQYLDFQIPVFFDWPEGVKYKVATKGRRAGITKGAANSFIEDLLDGEGPLLWGDTIRANIDKYFNRYFLPELKANKILHRWESQKHQLTINDHICDFRSADNPENWEGFGYKKIFLNEAGIILKNKELYANTVLPMLLDYPDSKLIAAGVPKGKKLKDGTDHPFYTLAKRAEEGNGQYQRISLTSYSNPILNPAGILALEDEIRAISGQLVVDQEIYGKFIEKDAINPFAYALSEEVHFDSTVFLDPKRIIHFSVDFNLIPFACLVANIFTDSTGIHVHFVDEVSIPMGSIPEMGERLRNMYAYGLHSCVMTGDSMGKNRNITQRDNASNYDMLRRIIGLRENQLKIPNNPSHETSKNDCNYLLHASCDPQSRIFVKINPLKCPTLANEIRYTQCDENGSIIKADRTQIAQRADQLDNFRYIVNTFLKTEIDRHQKQNFGKWRLH